MARPAHAPTVCLPIALGLLASAIGCGGGGGAPTGPAAPTPAPAGTTITAAGGTVLGLGERRRSSFRPTPW